MDFICQFCAVTPSCGTSNLSYLVLKGSL